MSWKTDINPGTAVWSGVEDYAAERIAELTATCILPETSERDIRAAQAGIAELKRLLAVPQMIAAEVQIRSHQGARKEY